MDQRHFYVNGNLDSSRPEDFCYNSLHEAAEAISDGTAEPPSVIYLEPVLKVSRGELICLYRFDESQGKDCTEITWYRKRDGRVLAVSREEPCRRYHLATSDIGSAIEVRVIPRGAYSLAAVEIHHTGTVPIGNRTTIAKLIIEYEG